MGARKIKKLKAGGISQLMIPLISLGVLIIFNLIRDPGFFSIGLSDTGVLTGNLVSVIDSASELAIIAMGMTLVTAACGGQDISVGAVGAIAGSIFVCTLQAMEKSRISRGPVGAFSAGPPSQHSEVDGQKQDALLRMICERCT